jgi:hypothetical protein
MQSRFLSAGAFSLRSTVDCISSVAKSRGGSAIPDAALATLATAGVRGRHCLLFGLGVVGGIYLIEMGVRWGTSKVEGRRKKGEVFALLTEE